MRDAHGAQRQRRLILAIAVRITTPADSGPGQMRVRLRMSEPMLCRSCFLVGESRIRFSEAEKPFLNLIDG